MTTTNPRQITCPACNAQPGHPCTAPTTNGRREVTWVHSSRTDEAEDWTPSDRLPNSAEAIARALGARDVELRCSFCGFGDGIPADAQGVRSVMEHAAYAHAGRADVLLVEWSTFMSGFENALMMGSTPTTEAEQTWRRTHATI